MAEPDFKNLNQTIKSSGAAWIAAKTSHSKYWGLPASTSLFGLALDPEKALAESLAARRTEPRRMMAVAPPPKRVDWRSSKNKNYVTPVRDQGSCGACVSFATCAVLESRSLIATGKPGVDLDLSEAHLFFCGTKNACAVGWTYEPAMAFAKKNGVGKEADFPYTPGNQACRAIDPVVKVKTYTGWASTMARKQALTRGPVVGGLQVFGDFYAYAGGVYQHVGGDFVGWHAVAIVGYDDVAGCWIAKNSWGTGWGELGFFRIAYGDCGIDNKVMFYEPEVRVLAGAGLA